MIWMKVRKRLRGGRIRRRAFAGLGKRKRTGSRRRSGGQRLPLRRAEGDVAKKHVLADFNQASPLIRSKLVSESDFKTIY